MRPFFLRRPAQPLNTTSARNCALLNQLATPGLGSLMAGRWLAGVGQLLLALAGFGMITGWFCFLALQLFQALSDDAHAGSDRSFAWLGLSGAVTFAVSWFWALITSLSLMREARGIEKGSVPPLLPPRA